MAAGDGCGICDHRGNAASPKLRSAPVNAAPADAWRPAA